MPPNAAGYRQRGSHATTQSAENQATTVVPSVWVLACLKQRQDGLGVASVCRKMQRGGAITALRFRVLACLKRGFDGLGVTPVWRLHNRFGALAKRCCVGARLK